jgi:hypothetical protein
MSSIRKRLSLLERAAAEAPPAADPRLSLPLEELRKRPPEELLRLHRQALGLDGASAAPVVRPDPEELARLRSLPLEELMRLHREALGL